MRLLLAVLALAVVVLSGCRSSSDTRARTEALERDLASQRQEMAWLRSEFDAQREATYRALAGIQSRLTDLDRTLGLASAEIWGDGSSTGAQLAMAQRTLSTIQAEVETLTRQVRIGTRTP